jgi:hypothetical protein
VSPTGPDHAQGEQSGSGRSVARVRRERTAPPVGGSRSAGWRRCTRGPTCARFPTGPPPPLRRAAWGHQVRPGSHAEFNNLQGAIPGRAPEPHRREPVLAGQGILHSRQHGPRKLHHPGAVRHGQGGARDGGVPLGTGNVPVDEVRVRNRMDNSTLWKRLGAGRRRLPGRHPGAEIWTWTFWQTTAQPCGPATGRPSPPGTEAWRHHVGRGEQPLDAQRTLVQCSVAAGGNFVFPIK